MQRPRDLVSSLTSYRRALPKEARIVKYMILLCYFILLLFVCLRKKSVATLFILIQIVSLSCIFLTGVDYPIDTLFKGFNIALTGIILTLIILPWMKMRKIKEVYFPDHSALRRITNSLIVLSSFSFVVLGITSVFVFYKFGYDINYFKYSEGVAEEFFYKALPIPVRALILANYLVNFSFFLVPLHFYYLGRRQYRLSLLCFMFSLNSVLQGLTFYSRAAIVNYVLVYICFLIILWSLIDRRLLKYLKIGLSVFGVIFLSYCVLITNERFTDHTSIYSRSIPYDSLIQDPAKYSYVDYLSQWYSNSMSVLNDYNSVTFKGQITFQSILYLLGQYHLIDYDTSDYTYLRKTLWPDHSDRFLGFVAYSIYDYGYILSLILCLGYFYLVRTLCPAKNSVSLIHLFYISLLVRFPAMAIFYSTVGSVVIPFLLLIPIRFYIMQRGGARSTIRGFRSGTKTTLVEKGRNQPAFSSWPLPAQRKGL